MSILWVAGDDDEGNSEDLDDDDDDVLLLDNVVDVWDDDDKELWKCEVEPSWVVDVGELRGGRWIREAEGENPRGDNNSLSESSESLYNGMGFWRFEHYNTPKQPSLLGLNTFGWEMLSRVV